MIARVEVVPWSIAMTNSLVVMSFLSKVVSRRCVYSDKDEEVEDSSQHRTNDGADDGNPRVCPVRAALTLDRQNRASNTRAEVTSGVDCVSGGATQGVADDDDDEGNAKRANRSFGVARDKDPEDKDSGADGLSDAVPSVGTNLGAGREDTELQSRIAILIEVLLEGQPAQDSTDKRTEELGNDVDGNVRASDKNSCSLICRNAVESRTGDKEVGDNLCMVTAGFRCPPLRKAT